MVRWKVWIFSDGVAIRERFTQLEYVYASNVITALLKFMFLYSVRWRTVTQLKIEPFGKEN